MSFYATYYGANGWLLELGSSRIVVDPWLTGDLSFAPGKWFLKGKLPRFWSIPKSIDTILLTQGLPDHAHKETLELFSPETSVIASPSAAKVVKEIGFKKIEVLNPDESTSIQNIHIMATAGAKVPTQENGYLITNNDISIYLEPHGFIDKSLSATRVDIAITPVVNVSIPFLGSFIKGKEVLTEIVDLLRPQYIFASTTGGDVTFEGVLSRTFNQNGTFEEAKKSIQGKSLLIKPPIGVKFCLSEINQYL